MVHQPRLRRDESGCQGERILRTGAGGKYISWVSARRAGLLWALREPHLAEDGRRIAKLRDDATKTKQECMDEVAQADFRTDAERKECGGVLPGAEVVRAIFLLAEETAAGKHGCGICGSASGGGPRPPNRRLAGRSSGAEWAETAGKAQN